MMHSVELLGDDTHQWLEIYNEEETELLYQIYISTDDLKQLAFNSRLILESRE